MDRQTKRREREHVCVRDRKRVCVGEIERVRECVCVCVKVWERVRGEDVLIVGSGETFSISTQTLSLKSDGGNEM